MFLTKQNRQILNPTTKPGVHVTQITICGGKININSQNIL